MSAPPMYVKVSEVGLSAFIHGSHVEFSLFFTALFKYNDESKFSLF